jgi:hypothetical protein
MFRSSVLFTAPQNSAEVVAEDREVNKISLVSTSDNKTLREVLACIAQKIVLKLRVALK